MTDTANAPERIVMLSRAKSWLQKRWFQDNPNEQHIIQLADYHADLDRDYTTHRDELVAAARAEGAREAQAKLDELRSDRPFIVGWNEGFAEAEYQQAHGKPSDGDLSPQYQHTAKEVAEAQAKIARLTEALTPSGDTKAAYMGEFEFIVFGMNDDGEECSHKITVPWTAIKEIMAAIKARAALQENADE